MLKRKIIKSILLIIFITTIVFISLLILKNTMFYPNHNINSITLINEQNIKSSITNEAQIYEIANLISKLTQYAIPNKISDAENMQKDTEYSLTIIYDKKVQLVSIHNNDMYVFNCIEENGYYDYCLHYKNIDTSELLKILYAV